MTNSLFMPAKSKRLARLVSIESPRAFKESVRVLRLGGLTPNERQALGLAQVRAGLQLRRRNLSKKERVQFRRIVRVKV